MSCITVKAIRVGEHIGSSQRATSSPIISATYVCPLSTDIFLYTADEKQFFTIDNCYFILKPI